MAFLLNQQATGLCTHGGSATPILGNPRVKVGGAAVLTVSTQFAVSDCPNVVGTAPFPCVLAMFAQGATRVKVMGQPVLLDSASAQNVPTSATLTIINPQARVKGT